MSYYRAVGKLVIILNSGETEVPFLLKAWVAVWVCFVFLQPANAKSEKKKKNSISAFIALHNVHYVDLCFKGQLTVLKKGNNWIVISGSLWMITGDSGRSPDVNASTQQTEITKYD